MSSVSATLVSVGGSRLATRLRVAGIRAVLASGQDHLLARARADRPGGAFDLAAAALVPGRRHALEHTSWPPRISVLTRGRLLTMAPAG